MRGSHTHACTCSHTTCACTRTFTMLSCMLTVLTHVDVHIHARSHTCSCAHLYAHTCSDTCTHTSARSAHPWSGSRSTPAQHCDSSASAALWWPLWSLQVGGPLQVPGSARPGPQPALAATSPSLLGEWGASHTTGLASTAGLWL